MLEIFRSSCLPIVLSVLPSANRLDLPPSNPVNFRLLLLPEMLPLFFLYSSAFSIAILTASGTSSFPSPVNPFLSLLSLSPAFPLFFLYSLAFSIAILRASGTSSFPLPPPSGKSSPFTLPLPLSTIPLVCLYFAAFSIATLTASGTSFGPSFSSPETNPLFPPTIPADSPSGCFLFC
uniref:Uncharacterized protein n=1 Tax=Opuntia streptacantha TaxID=393608 RepID=A0A7C9AJB9_OPUST